MAENVRFETLLNNDYSLIFVPANNDKVRGNSHVSRGGGDMKSSALEPIKENERTTLKNTEMKLPTPPGLHSHRLARPHPNDSLEKASLHADIVDKELTYLLY